MAVSKVIKLGIAATALLLLPRRSSSRSDKVLKPRQVNQHNHLAKNKHDDNLSAGKNS